MTFPIANVGQLYDALILYQDPSTPIVVVTRDGSRWQVDGVEAIVDERERPVEFQLRVGPPDVP